MTKLILILIVISLGAVVLLFLKIIGEIIVVVVGGLCVVTALVYWLIKR